MSEHNHSHYLLNALAEAKKAVGQCAPNPCVGALIVKDQRIMATGFHRGPGEKHAEIDAFSNATESVQGATMYVTLEPCCHVGRTPPCTDAIIKNRIARVVFAYVDPNPQVAGQGQAQLQAHGIECEHQPLAQIDDFYRPYAYWTKTKKPWVRLKIASTCEGVIAHHDGSPIAITNEKTNQFTMDQRERADAIVTSVQTVMNDNPRLTVRKDQEVGKAIYIIDRHARLSLDRDCLGLAKSVTLLHCDPMDPDRVDHFESAAIRLQHSDSLGAMIQAIGKEGVHEVWVEVGARLAYLLLENQLVNEFFWYQSLSSSIPEGLSLPFTMSYVKTTLSTFQFSDKRIEGADHKIDRVYHWKSTDIL